MRAHANAVRTRAMSEPEMVS